MKKSLAILLLCITALTITSCSMKISKSEEGFRPMLLTEREESILSAFGLSGKSAIYEFKAPKEAISMRLMIHSFEPDKGWETQEGFGISIGEEREISDRLEGIFTMRVEDDYSLSLGVKDAHSIYTSSTPPFITEDRLDEKYGFGSSTNDNHRDIEIGKEIPLIQMKITSSNISFYSFMDDINEMMNQIGDSDEYVQIVTLVFSDKDFL